jgi:hypothetical protein
MTATRQEIDLLITGGTIVTMDKGEHIYEDGAIAVNGSDIVFVGSRQDALQKLSAKETLDAAGNWSVPNADLSSLNDGDLTLTADTVDQAGNPATASTQADIDLGVFIDIDTGPDGLPLTPFLLRAVDELTGTTDAEDGQTVTVTLSDGTTTNTFTGTVSGGA